MIKQWIAWASAATLAWCSSAVAQTNETPAPKASDAAKTTKTSKARPGKSDEGLVAALTDVQKIAAKRTTFSVTFEQTTFSALRNKTNSQKGTLEFKAPRSFRWETGSTRKEIYVSNGTEFWKYSEAAKHAQKLAADVGELRFLDVLLRPGMLTDDYVVKQWTRPSKPDEGNVSISLLPPDKSETKLYIGLEPRKAGKVKTMYAVIDKSRGFVDELRIEYDNRNRNRIVFGSISEDPIPAERFQFTPPPGTAVDK